jgi:hypothetical protein
LLFHADKNTFTGKCLTSRLVSNLNFSHYHPFILIKHIKATRIPIFIMRVSG